MSSEAMKQQPQMHPSLLVQASGDQNLASAPIHSSWVGASAGTGKTKVLSDRVLRLLLPRGDMAGTQAHKILCLTFTKAGAAEMNIRIAERLSEWASISEEELKKDLAKLTGDEPDAELILAARKLFASVIDAPGGLNVMTIHAFCESVLRRFPVEAGLPPSFEKLEDSRPLLKKSVLATLTEIQNSEKEKAAFHELMRNLSADDLSLLAGALFKTHRLDFEGGAAQVAGAYETQARARLNLGPQVTKESAVKHFVDEVIPFFSELKAYADAMKKPNDTLLNHLDMMSAFAGWIKLKCPSHNDIKERFEADFCTQKKTIRSSSSRDEGVKNLYQKFEGIYQKLIAVYSALESCALTGQLFAFAHKTYEVYAREKNRQGLLDFDDLITRTADLFQGRLFGGSIDNAFEWVLYRLDGGIDHILVDEAQDTNADQWAVIDTLVQPLLQGLGAQEDIFRTLFVVGDDKQSIYGFQGAEPGIFDEKRRFYKRAFAQVEHPFEDVPLNVSFRSQAPILRFVDRLFEEKYLRDSLTDQDVAIEHKASKMIESGQVCLWPLEKGAPDKTDEKWPLPPLEKKGEQDELPSHARLADKIAAQISDWINAGRLIHTAKGTRPVEAGDILILLRRRSSFQKDLVRELKKRGIEVEGLDRLILTEHIAIQDILAAAKVALLPEDDYTLACLLKSPLIGWDDEQLMRLSFTRGENERLYHALRNNDAYGDILSWLHHLQELATSQTPYGFFAALLASPCPADQQGSGWRAIYRRLSEEAFDPLEAFLGQAAGWTSPKHYQGLQAFVAEAESNPVEIKREMDKSNGRVRIMTAHGAKGLQAPIVFLADAARDQSAARKLASIDSNLYTQKNEATVFSTSEARKTVPALIQAQKDKEEADLDEYRRLLYVALTRAEDELYICGSMNDEKRQDEDSWYALIERLFQNMKAQAPEGYMVETDELERMIFKRKDIRPMDAPSVVKDDDARSAPKDQAQITLPAWVFEKREHREEKLRVLQPSKAALPDERLISPLDPHVREQGERRFKRGLIIHAALQFVPDLPQDKRSKALSAFLAQKAHRLSADQQQEISDEIHVILNDPLFAPVFGEGSRAEVPILGAAGPTKTRVSGQVDRLVILPDKVLIIDYKTNRPAPENPQDVPEAYRAQLKAYKEILTRIYTDREISCGLLWTHIPKLVTVDV